MRIPANASHLTGIAPQKKYKAGLPVFSLPDAFEVTVYEHEDNMPMLPPAAVARQMKKSFKFISIISNNNKPLPYEKTLPSTP